MTTTKPKPSTRAALSQMIQWANALKPPAVSNPQQSIDRLCDAVRYCDQFLMRYGLDHTWPITRYAKSIDDFFEHEVPSTNPKHPVRYNNATFRLVDETWEKCREAFVRICNVKMEAES